MGLKITGPNELAISDEGFIQFLLSNTSVSFETEVDKSFGSVTMQVFHFEGGDFTYEIHARKDIYDRWRVHSVEIVAGEVKG